MAMCYYHWSPHFRRRKDPLSFYQNQRWSWSKALWDAHSLSFVAWVRVYRTQWTGINSHKKLKQDRWPQYLKHPEHTHIWKGDIDCCDQVFRWHHTPMGFIGLTLFLRCVREFMWVSTLIFFQQTFLSEFSILKYVMESH